MSRASGGFQAHAGMNSSTPLPSFSMTTFRIQSLACRLQSTLLLSNSLRFTSMPDRIPGGSAGSNNLYTPPTGGSNQSRGSAQPGSSLMPTSTAQPPSRGSSGSAPRAPSQASSSGRWSASGFSASSSLLEPLLGSQAGSSSPPSQTSSDDTARSQSSSQPPGSDVSRLVRVAPPARGGQLYNAYASLTSVSSTSRQRNRHIATIRNSIGDAVRQTSQGGRPSQERVETLVDLAKDHEERGSDVSGGG
jgi:hypothetical protein